MNTREELQDYILRQLGAPTLDVELTEDQLNDCIDYTIKEFSSFAYDGQLKETVILTVDGKGKYQLPDFVTSIITVRSVQSMQNYGANYVPDRWSEEFFKAFGSGSSGIENIITISSMMSLFERYVVKELHYEFNEYKNQLYITEAFKGNILVYYTYEYVPDKIDRIFNQQWVKDMSVAKARLQQAVVVGKYDQALVGGARINYSDMKSSAEQDIADLKEQLFSKYAGPAPILIG